MTHKLIKTAMIVLAMITGISGTTAYAQKDNAPADKSDPRTWRDEGLYYYNQSEPNNLFVPIDANQPEGTKSGGYGTHVAQAYSGGWATNKQQSLMSGAHAKRQIHHTSPKFYFYFKSDNITPNQFTLVRFIEKRNNRIMVTGRSNAYGSTSGIDEKQKVDFTYDKIADGTFKVYTRDPLSEGEYCFIYTGSAASSFADVVYDFGITSE